MFLFTIYNSNSKEIYSRNFAVVLCVCETWSLVFKKKKRQKVFENRVLREIFWSTTQEVRGSFRKLHIGVIHGIYHH